MENTSREMKKRYFDRIKDMPDRFNPDYRMRRMARRLHMEFDKVWSRLENKDATIEEWDKALDKWLKAELI